MGSPWTKPVCRLATRPQGRTNSDPWRYHPPALWDDTMSNRGPTDVRDASSRIELTTCPLSGPTRKTAAPSLGRSLVMMSLIRTLSKPASLKGDKKLGLKAAE